MKKKVFIILPLILLGIFLFYWFQIRPSNIRKNCELQVFSKTGYGQKSKNNLYRQCLIRNGLKPESIFVNVD